MIHQLKKLKTSAVLVAFLSGITFTEATTGTATVAYPKPTDGLSFGFGAGVKLLNLKNIATINPNRGAPIRSGDGFANSSSPVIGIYARKYMPDVLYWPTFLGLEFNYLTDMRKRSIYTSLNNPDGRLDSGYRYQERWDARLMLGAQLLSFSQVDFWAQAGLQLTNFDYYGVTTPVRNGPDQIFKMDNNLALAPAGGLEMRFSQPNLVSNGVVTDFILGWTAGYRNAMKVAGTATLNQSAYSFSMSSNWSHTFGLKVMFRY